MRFTNSIDGEKRTNFKVDFRFTIEELVEFFVASEWHKGTAAKETEELIERARKIGKREFMNAVKEGLYMDGGISAPYYIGDNNFNTVNKTILEIIKGKVWVDA